MYNNNNVLLYKMLMRLTTSTQKRSKPERPFTSLFHVGSEIPVGQRLYCALTSSSGPPSPTTSFSIGRWFKGLETHFAPIGLRLLPTNFKRTSGGLSVWEYLMYEERVES